MPSSVAFPAGRARVAAGLATLALVCCSALGLPLRAEEEDPAVPAPASLEDPGPAAAAGSAAPPASGEVAFSSRISPVDACNRAQGLRPAGSTVTSMHYERPAPGGESASDAERVFSCRVLWSTDPEARPTGRPILFGPTL
jgi:hypothetical protein